MSSCPLGRRGDGVGVALDLCSPGEEGCLESCAYGAGGRRVAAAAKGLPPAWWEVQNGHVGWGDAIDAADAAGGSWAGTKQSDADRPMWGARADARQIVRIQTERYLRGGTSTTRHVRWTKNCVLLPPQQTHKRSTTKSASYTLKTRAATPSAALRCSSLSPSYSAQFSAGLNTQRATFWRPDSVWAHNAERHKNASGPHGGARGP